MSLLASLYLAWTNWRQERDLRRLGWSGVYVGDYREPPSWAYTIGFDETLAHPEIVVCDMPKATASRLFRRLFDDIGAGRLIIEDGALWAEAHSRCAWRKVHDDRIGEWLVFAWARRLMQTGLPYGLEAYQLVLSDSEGVLPWEPGYDERLRPLQPALYEPGEQAEALT